jgi:hypothetical protein
MTEATMKVIAREPPKSARAPYLITVQDPFFENQKFVLRTWDKGLFDLCPLEAVRTFAYHTAPSNKGMLDYFLDAVKQPAEAPKPKREELVRIPEVKPPPQKATAPESRVGGPSDDVYQIADRSAKDALAILKKHSLPQEEFHSVFGTLAIERFRRSRV